MQTSKTLKLPAAFVIAALTLCGFSTSLYAHEYWLDPIAPVIRVNSAALINIKNGERFSGPTYPYNPDRVKSVSVTSEANTQHYTGRLGDYPAIRPTLATPGVHSIAIETLPQNLIYDSWEKFTGFLDYHGFEDIEERHLKRSLPKVKVSENYTRSAKTLILAKGANAGDTIGKQDLNALMPVGHVFEMVLLEAPFGEIATIRIKLLFNGEPLGNRQTELFWHGDKSSRLTTITNADGIASFEISNNGDYLVNAVHLTKASSNDAHWDSHWASITFTH